MGNGGKGDGFAEFAGTLAVDPELGIAGFRDDHECTGERLQFHGHRALGSGLDANAAFDRRVAHLEYADAECGAGRDRNFDGGESFILSVNGDAGAARRRTDRKQAVGTLEPDLGQRQRLSCRNLQNVAPTLVPRQLDEDPALAGRNGNRAGRRTDLVSVYADGSPGRD